jgi:hypothetical protein
MRSESATKTHSQWKYLDEVWRNKSGLVRSSTELMGKVFLTGSEPAAWLRVVCPNFEVAVSKLSWSRLRFHIFAEILKSVWSCCHRREGSPIKGLLKDPGGRRRHGSSRTPCSHEGAGSHRH